MDIALIKHAQYDVHRNKRGQNQERLVLQGCAESLSGPLKTTLHAGRELQIAHRSLDPAHGVSKRSPWRQIKGDRSRRELSLPVDSERDRPPLTTRKGTERYCSSSGRGDVNVAEIFRRLLEFRRNFQDHTVLVYLSEHC